MAKGVTNEQQKVALLLHTGGLELQELYFSLTGEEEDKQYAECISILDSYFVPKVNLPFERHQFRQMSQALGEKVDQFVSRLRQDLKKLPTLLQRKEEILTSARNSLIFLRA